MALLERRIVQFTGLPDYSFRHLNDPTLPSVSEIIDLLGKAILIQASSGFSNLTMIEVVQHHLNSTKSEQTALNRTIAERFPSIPNPWATLETLDYVLPRLPMDDSSTERAVGYLIMVVASTMVVGLRFYVRRFVSPKEIRREDWWCLAALIWSIALAASFFVNGLYGGGTHLWTLTLDEAKDCAMTLVASEYVYVVAHWFAKINLIIFYYRLSPAHTYRLCVKLIFAQICCMTIVGFFITTFQCRQFDWWNFFDSARCINRMAAMQAHGAGMILADLALLALPMPMVWKLKLKTMEKFLLAAVFALGGLISVVTFVRVFALYDWLTSNDWSFDSNCPWHQLEISLCVIISCAPAIHRLLFHKSGETRNGGGAKVSGMDWTKGGMFRPTRAAAIRARGRGSSFARSEGLDDGPGGARYDEPESRERADRDREESNSALQVITASTATQISTVISLDLEKTALHVERS